MLELMQQFEFTDVSRYIIKFDNKRLKQMISNTIGL